MTFYDFLYTESTANQFIKNFKTQLRNNCAMVSQGTEVGILNVVKELIWYINSVRDIYGTRIAGTALEEARRHVDITEPWLYYDAREGTEVDKEQDLWIATFLSNLKALSDDLKEEVEELKRYEEEKRYQQEELENAYRKERRSVQRKARRKGVDLKLPKIPKKITAGSVRRLQSIKAKL